MRVVAVITEDFALFHDVVAALKARRIPFISLSPGDPIPANVGAAIVSMRERDAVRFAPKVVAEGGESGVEASVVEALRHLSGRETIEELVVGIDPGLRPGVAVLGDGTVLETFQAESPEDAARRACEAVRRIPARNITVRIGHGDTINRNRTVNVLLDSGLYAGLEVVDERGTTTISHSPDTLAAIRIASGKGSPVGSKFAVRPTAGMLRDIQRRSRLKSDGKLAISSALARMVGTGEIDMEKAIALQERKRRRKR